MEVLPSKAEEHGKSGYKSWKKKYRKMRIVFDHKMADGEDLHKQEAKACATVKRLAVENDRLLDLLSDINNSPQIPPEKRIDVSATPSTALKSLASLLEIPHTSFSSAKDTDLTVPEGETFPTSFLSADDVDSYILDVDTSLGHMMPSLAPRAHDSSMQAHLKNPTSVTNWLRKHAPKIFLQDGEHDDEDAGHTATGTGRRGRGSRGERGGRGRGRGRGRASNVSERPTSSAADWDASMDEEQLVADAPVRGKRKRAEDPGYRPGGSTRPVKKKRKSEDGRRASKKDIEV